MIGLRSENVNLLTDPSIWLALATVLMCYISYNVGKYIGEKKFNEDTVNVTIEYLRRNNFIRYRYDENNEIELLDVDKREEEL